MMVGGVYLSKGLINAAKMLQKDTFYKASVPLLGQSLRKEIRYEITGRAWPLMATTCYSMEFDQQIKRF